MDNSGQEKASGLEEGQATFGTEKEPEQHQSRHQAEKYQSQQQAKQYQIVCQAEQHQIQRQTEQHQSRHQIELELVLLRHGHTKWNKERRYLGSSDLPLLPEEREKLAALREQPELTGSFWRVYCSNLLRCRETLSSIAPSLEAKAVYDSRLQETCFGEWEGRTYEQLKNNPQYRSWIDDPAAVTPPGGEAWEDFAARLEQFLSGLVDEAAAEIRDGNSSLTQWESGEGSETTVAVDTNVTMAANTAVEVDAHTNAAMDVNTAVTMYVNTAEEVLADTAADANTAVAIDANTAVSVDTAADAAEAPRLCREEPLKLRVLIITHGGVIREWLAQAESGKTFYTTAAPPPGTVAVLQLLYHAGGWAWNGTDARI